MKAKLALEQGLITEKEYNYYVSKMNGSNINDLPDKNNVVVKNDTFVKSDTPVKSDVSIKSNIPIKSDVSVKSNIPIKSDVGVKNNKLKRNLTKVIIIILLLNLGLWTFLFTLNNGGFDNGLTGFVVGTRSTQDVNSLFTNDGYITTNLTNVTSVSVSGMLTNGSVNITLADGRVVYSGDSNNQIRVYTDKISYSKNSTIKVIVTPININHTLWIDDGVNKIPIVNNTFTTTPGNYTIDAIINDSGSITKTTNSFVVRNDTNVSLDIARSIDINTLIINDACQDTCNIEKMNKTVSLIINLSKGATLNLNAITVTLSNNAPTELIQIPDLTLDNADGTISLNLSNYFTDVDDDELTYDINNIVGVTETINGSILTLKGELPGNYTTYVYVSDGVALTQSNDFKIIVSDDITDPDGDIINNTTNGSEQNNINNSVVFTNVTNVNNTGSINTVLINDTNETLLLDCSNPDPNLRSQECFMGVEEKYFDERNEVRIEDKNREVVGRINAIGNLLIKGDIIENSDGSPSKDDFVIGYADGFDFVPTAWIDSKTGDFHIKGLLHEEEINIIIPPNSYGFQGIQGINLGYVNPRNGDLYIRGNLIPYRRHLS